MSEEWPLLGRREFAGSAAAVLLAGCTTGGMKKMEGQALFGLIGQMKAIAGKRSELIALLTAGSARMPGNRLYLVAEDAADGDAIWVTEVWDSKEAHAASLKLPSVRDAITRARPILAGFGVSAEIRPIGMTF